MIKLLLSVFWLADFLLCVVGYLCFSEGLFSLSISSFIICIDLINELKKLGKDVFVMKIVYMGKNNGFRLFLDSLCR